MHKRKRGIILSDLTAFIPNAIIRNVEDCLYVFFVCRYSHKGVDPSIYIGR